MLNLTIFSLKDNINGNSVNTLLLDTSCRTFIRQEVLDLEVEEKGKSINRYLLIIQ